MRLPEYAQAVGVVYRTAWNHFRRGLIAGAYQLPSGTVVVPDSVVLTLEKMTDRRFKNKIQFLSHTPKYQMNLTIQKTA